MKQLYISLRFLCVTLIILFIIFFNNIIWAQSPKKSVKKITYKEKIINPEGSKRTAGTRILLMTDSGNMVIRLYDSTPLHRDNFITKVKDGFYDSLLFHRVIKGFMIQGGDPDSKNAKLGVLLGEGEAPGGRIPAEFKPYLFHKKGVLAAARDDNPEKASSNCQFYIVQGKKITDGRFDTLEKKTGHTIPIDQKEIYKTLGGAPHLDQRYTVYGEVEIGMEVIDKIANVLTDSNDRPLNDVRMKMKVLPDEEVDKLWEAAFPKSKKTSDH